jgi:hypothetical protein
MRPTLTVVTALAVLLACGAGTTTESPGSTTPTELPAAFRLFSDSVQISLDGDVVVLRTKNVPDHKSVYFPTTDPRYEAYNGSNPLFAKNPNSIVAQQMVFRIPLNPKVATNHAATPLGAIGISVNGVALFNQYAGPARPLSNEINSFDQANGHPQQTGVYHYHVEPLRITAARGLDALIGFLLDGFPVYGPLENGRRITNTDLDQFHGHTSGTKEYPNGIYHYHITADDPYINGSGFYGTAGTVSG